MFKPDDLDLPVFTAPGGTPPLFKKDPGDPPPMCDPGDLPVVH